MRRVDDNGFERPTSQTAGERLTRIEVRIGYLMRDLEALKALVSGQAVSFTEEQRHKLLQMLKVFEEEATDKKDFDKAVRVSVVTMVCSVLLFSILVPVIQHVLFH